VRQHYLDFLSREPEVGEPWTALLNNCSDVNNNPLCDRLTVSAAFFGSPEFQLKGYFVYRSTSWRSIVYALQRVDSRHASSDRANAGRSVSEEGGIHECVCATNGVCNISLMPPTSTCRRYGSLQSVADHTPDPAAPDGTNKVTLTTPS